jgi:hypothetical protein
MEDPWIPLENDLPTYLPATLARPNGSQELIYLSVDLL